jgi:GT2 family glycosyltransferase
LIPVLAAPTLYRTDLLTRMVASIDTDVETLLIIDNGGRVPPEFPAHVVHLPHNIGVGASWNLVFKLTPRAPWWLIVNDDLAFGEGDLAGLEAEMLTDEPKIAMLLGFAAFAINQQALELIGFFDENFHPAYCEDNDMTWRAKLANVPLVNVESHIDHEGSATIRGHQLYMDQNGVTFTQNLSYYRSKWGGNPGEEIYETPFDAGGDPAAVRIHMERLNQFAWARLKPGT